MRLFFCKSIVKTRQNLFSVPISTVVLCTFWLYFIFVGLNFVGRTRDLSGHHSSSSSSYHHQPSMFTVMECDTSPASTQPIRHHQHRPQRYPPPPLTGCPPSFQYPTKHGGQQTGASALVNGPAPGSGASSGGGSSASKDSADRDGSSPMVGVCVQQSSVVIH